MAFWLSLLAAAVLLVVAVRPLSQAVPAWRTPSRARTLALLAGIGYGLLGRVVFGLGYAHGLPGWLSSAFAVMSCSFLILMPLVIGYLHQSAPDPVLREHPRVHAFFAPMTPVMMMLVLMVCLAIEGVICVAMALPLFLVLAGIGGLLGLFVRRQLERRARNAGLTLMLALPYLLSPIEQGMPAPRELRQVTNTVIVHAPPNVVWRQIKSVRAIDRAELPSHFSHFIGLPRAVEATLSHDGVGGVRVAKFERGLEFRETVDGWEPERRLSFTIAAEPAPPTALDEHVAVGGKYFDVLDGTYELEPRADGTTLLRLTSHQRLSTHFNFYARLWTDFIMSDLQAAIMAVIRARCEREAASAQ